MVLIVLHDTKGLEPIYPLILVIKVSKISVETGSGNDVMSGKQIGIYSKRYMSEFLPDLALYKTFLSLALFSSFSERGSNIFMPRVHLFQVDLYSV